jgi:hypothetical protein
MRPQLHRRLDIGNAIAAVFKVLDQRAMAQADDKSQIQIGSEAGQIVVVNAAATAVAVAAGRNQNNRKGGQAGTQTDCLPDLFGASVPADGYEFSDVQNVRNGR